MATNLTAKRLRLLFVADEIPDRLERVVEFLNSQMPNIEVLAVEIKQFRSNSTQTLVPRILGRIAKAPIHGPVGPRQMLTRESFLDEFTPEEARNAAERLLNVAQKFDSTLSWGPSGVSIRAQCSRWRQPITVAWLYPPSKAGMGWMRTRDFTFGVGILDSDPPPDGELRTILEHWVDVFRADDFTEEASSKGVAARSVPYEAVAWHIDLLEDRLLKILKELRQL